MEIGLEYLILINGQDYSWPLFFKAKGGHPNIAAGRICQTNHCDLFHQITQSEVEIFQAGILPSVFEYLDHSPIDCVEEHLGAWHHEGRFGFLISLESVKYLYVKSEQPEKFYVFSSFPFPFLSLSFLDLVTQLIVFYIYIKLKN